MGFHLKHINKYQRWVKKNLAAYRDNRRFDPTYAKNDLALSTAQLLQKPAMIDHAARRKHKWVLAYMEKHCSETIRKYRDLPAPENLWQPQRDPKIWSMWWQGEETADPLFQMCINSARLHTHQPVLTLTKDNYRIYFEIPDYILQKHAQGKVMIQHICDLMVVSILAAEGGFFTGATVWWSQDAPDGVLNAPFYTCRAVSNSQENMSRSRWVGYVMGGNKEFPLFSFARDCLLEYWEKCDHAVDYLMLDYVFELAYQNIPCVKEMIDSLPEQNNMLRNELIMHLGDPYDAETFRRYTEGDTFLYKLSWKFGKKNSSFSDGRQTNYGHMLEDTEHIQKT
jgi:hypothetical protein